MQAVFRYSISLQSVLINIDGVQIYLFTQSNVVKEHTELTLEWNRFSNIPT